MNNLIEYNEQNILRLKGICVDFSYHASPSNLTRYVNFFETRGCNSIMKKIYKNRGLNRSTSKDCSDEFIGVGGGFMINYLTFKFLNIFIYRLLFP